MLYNDDCLNILKELQTDSIDCIITDPPYQLSTTKKYRSDKEDKPFGKIHASKGFMGKTWDILPSVEIWKECLRVLKPGAFAFIMTTPRQDSLCQILMDLTQAGFRTDFTSIYHTYASGFPKASNVSKLVDKKLGCVRDIIGNVGEMNGRNITKHKKEHNVFSKINGWDKNITIPASEQAKKLDGAYTGFSPKPAVEIILVVMKPLSEKSYTDQALKNYKGITWLNDCRIPYISDKDKESARFGSQSDIRNNNYLTPTGIYAKNVLSSETGRFPANLICSDDILNGCRITKPNSFSRYSDLDIWFENKLRDLSENIQKTFPFLIESKPSRKEKDKGLENTEIKKGGGMKGTEDKSLKTGNGNERNNMMKNTHPCLHPSSLVVTDGGLREINEVSINDKVYSEDGKFHKVIDKTIHSYNEDLFSIKIQGSNLKVEATHNHPFLIYTPQRIKNGILDFTIQWKEADKIEKGDYTMTPILSEIENNEIKDNNFWFFAGLWLAEGSLQKSNHGENIYPVFSLHKKEEFLSSKMKLITNKKVSVYQRKDSQGISIIIFDPILGEEFKNLFNSGARNKQLHPSIFNLKKELKQSFLDGYLFGDGTIVRGLINAKTSSKKLSYQLKLIGNSLGYNVSLYECSQSKKDKFIRGRKINNKNKYYQLYFNIKNRLQSKRKPSRPTIIEYNNKKYILNFIKSIEKLKYKGDVINLCIEGSPTFQTAIGMSHNTVKSIKLMSYLITLGSREDDIILDPFMGSGSTGVACKLLNRQFVGIEREKDYFEIAEQRIKSTLYQGKLL